jgi:predicted aldo/keto reductase-like oxidoreductase
MKTAPGSVEVPPFDPENPSERYARYIERQMEQGEAREVLVKRIQDWIAEQEREFESTKPFMEKHGITSKQDLQVTAVKWVLGNPDMHTVCIGFRDFDAIDRLLPLSGSKLTRSEVAVLDQYRMACSSRYCRHGCVACAGSCPHSVPVSTVMRYAYYFTEQGREKHAMAKYVRLAGRDGSLCEGCSAPCVGACPYGVNIQAGVLSAHDLLTLA